MVQKWFKGRRKPNSSGAVDIFSGLIYCGDCGSRMYLRRVLKYPKENNYMCKTYQMHGNDHCTAHRMTETDIHAIVLQKIREITAYVRENPDEFYQIASRNAKMAAAEEMKAYSRKKDKIENRITELDSIIRCLYEDRVLGRITVERYESLSAEYEKKQADLKNRLEEMDYAMSESEKQERLIKKFIEDSKKYIDIQELTAEILRTFISRIEVYEKEKWHSRSCGNDIVIHFTVEYSQRMNLLHKNIVNAKTSE